ncbi:Ankyrin repeats (3 copies) [Babesia microti strain RI]|uniref:Ankyrin repeats (3 copies) n=1 Tax=Babesia microti (strain RI) TaxID=1133968 RepID=A0A0K3ARU2_BABMR|nr:Ankyrin repeats (3 copies) [Babesia microti strain RI]CTQ41353.1 Ankyrin repeats (3 copies) [Babesia microti strain RI]|eukprot:XP_012649364.1 Ankyrin repeats (3 copies) [Babesia microti strain RI]
MSLYSEEYSNHPLVVSLSIGGVEGITEVLRRDFYCYHKDYPNAQKFPDFLIDRNTRITPLYQLTQRKNEQEALEIARLLIEEFLLCNPGHLDLIGQSCLFYAARDGYAKLCQYLCKSGADVKQADNLGQTCLFYAAREGHVEVLKVLIDLGADINAQDNNKQTCLFYACRDGRFEAVKFLLDKNINYAHKDTQRRSALTFARSKNHSAIVNLLKQHMAETTNINMSSGSIDHSKTNKTTISQSGIPVSWSSSDVAVKYDESTVDSEGKKRYRLQYKPFDNDPNLWLDAPLVKIIEFERRFPHLANWPKTANLPTAIRNPFIKQWYSAATLIIQNLSKYDGGHIFERLVDAKKQNCPDYYDVIKSPMSFSCIKAKLKKSQYESPQQFLNDVQLVFDNCHTYNKTGTWVALTGKAIEKYFNNQLLVSGFNDYVVKHEQIKQHLENVNTSNLEYDTQIVQACHPN